MKYVFLCDTYTYTFPLAYIPANHIEHMIMSSETYMESQQWITKLEHSRKILVIGK